MLGIRMEFVRNAINYRHECTNGIVRKLTNIIRGAHNIF